MLEASDCLLCGSAKIEVLEQVATADITRCYERAMTDILKRNFETHPVVNYCYCNECDLRYFSPQVTGSQEYYSYLQNLPWYYLEEKPEYQVAKKWISAGDRLLEIGCGGGAFSKHVSTAVYTGLEFSDDAVRTATGRGLHVEKVSVEEYVLQHEQEYDVVCAFQVLEHVGGVHGFIGASAKALRPGGLLIYCVPSEDSYVGSMPNAALNLPPHHITRWTDAALRSIARLFPLELVSIEHEDLADLHKSTFSALLVLKTINRLCGRKTTRLVDHSPRQRLLLSASYRLGSLLAKSLDEPKLLPRGHSVTVVLRKAASTNPSLN